MSKPEPLYDSALGMDVSWPEGVDPANWRDMPEPEGIDNDDDDWYPTPDHVVEALGFDPDIFDKE